MNDMDGRISISAENLAGSVLGSALESLCRSASEVDVVPCLGVDFAEPWAIFGTRR